MKPSMSKKRVVAIGFLTIALSGCGKLVDSKTVDLPSRDGSVAWLRGEFSKAEPIKNVKELNLGKYWICRQRSALKGSSHTGKFWQMFKQRGLEVVNDTTWYLDQRETMIGLFGVGQKGTSGSYSMLKTDRYSLVYAGNTAFSTIRKMRGNGGLIVEWSIPRCAQISGRSLSDVLPELGPTCMSTPSVAQPTRDAFLYALCEPEKPLSKVVSTTPDSCDTDTGLCTILTIVMTNHTAMKPINSYSQNNALSSGGVQYAYNESLSVEDKTCTRKIAVLKPVFDGISEAMEIVKKNGTGALSEPQKAFLELFMRIQEKIQESRCTSKDGE